MGKFNQCFGWLGSFNEPDLRREPPLPVHLLHKCVEEREIERRSRVHGFNARQRRGVEAAHFEDHDIRVIVGSTVFKNIFISLDLP